MHQIRFRLRLRPRPRWGAYNAARPPSWIWEPFRGRGLGWGRGGKGRGRGGRGKWRRGKRRAQSYCRSRAPQSLATELFRHLFANSMVQELWRIAVHRASSSAADSIKIYTESVDGLEMWLYRNRSRQHLSSFALLLVR